MNTSQLETNTQTIERLTRERDAAKKVCAEMLAVFDNENIMPAPITMEWLDDWLKRRADALAHAKELGL